MVVADNFYIIMEEKQLGLLKNAKISIKNYLLVDSYEVNIFKSRQALQSIVSVDLEVSKKYERVNIADIISNNCLVSETKRTIISVVLNIVSFLVFSCI